MKRDEKRKYDSELIHLQTRIDGLLDWIKRNIYDHVNYAQIASDLRNTCIKRDNVKYKLFL